MTTRNPSRRFSPSLPSGKHIGIAIASAAAGIVIGAAAVSQPFQSDDNPSTVASVPQASTNIAAGSGVTNDSIQPSARERKLSPTGVNGFRDFDPDVVVPGFGSAAASPDPTSYYESWGDLTGAGLSLSVSSAPSPDPTSYYESLGDLTGAGVASNETRRLSPNGINGFRDFDPRVVYSPAIVAFEAFPGANQVAAYPAETIDFELNHARLAPGARSAR